MSSSIVTWTGHRSAKERASQAWGAGHGERIAEQEQQRHERLMAAIRKLEVAVESPGQSRYERGDTSYWRNRRDENLRLQNARLQRKIERIRRERIRREASR